MTRRFSLSAPRAVALTGVAATTSADAKPKHHARTCAKWRHHHCVELRLMAVTQSWNTGYRFGPRYGLHVLPGSCRGSMCSATTSAPISLRLSRQLHLPGRSHDLRDHTGDQRADALSFADRMIEGRRCAGGLFCDSRLRSRVLAALAKQGVTSLGRVHASPRTAVIHPKGPPRVEARGGQAAQDLQNLPLRPRQRRQPALRPLHDRPRQMRADGPRRADQDQE